jgi:hypothetical protein
MVRESRLADIYKSELRNKGLLGALVSAIGERTKEKTDIRRLLPSSGLTGAAFGKIFGKAYKYNDRPRSSIGSVRNVGSTVGSPGDSAVSQEVNEKLTRISTDNRITAKNTIVLPAMARDMNLTRMNMQKLVNLSGGKASTKSDMFFKRAGEREDQYESQYKKNTVAGKSATATPTAGGGGLGSLLSGLGGGILSGIGSAISGIASSLGSIGGGILTGLGAVFGGLGIIGLVGFAVVGWIIKQFFDSIPFGKIGESFGEVGTEIGKFFKGEGDLKTFTDSLKGVKSAFSLMIEAINLKTGIISDLFNDLGGGGGILALLLGARVAAGIVSGWLPLLATPWGAIAALVGISGYALYDAYKRATGRPEDNKPLTPQEEIDKNTNAQAGGFKPPMVVAAEKRKNAEKLKKDQDSISKIDDDNKYLNSLLENPTDRTNIDDTKQQIEKNNVTKQSIIRRNPTLNQTQENASENARFLGRVPAPVPSTTPTPAGSSSRQIIESYLGRAISDQEYDALLRATGAEAGSNPSERAAVASVILNRSNKSGKTITDVLNAAYQFQAITGPRGNQGTTDNPYSANAKKIIPGIDKQISDNLSSVPKGLDSFTSAIPGAYKDVGGQDKFDKKMKEMKELDGQQIGQTMFATNKPSTQATPSPKVSGGALAAASVGTASTMASGAPTIVNAPVTNNMSSGGGGGNMAAASVYDNELAKKFFNSSAFA